MVRVIVADDSDAIRLVLKDILDIGGHQLVGEATNGDEAVKRFIETKPDIILLDMAMPKKDGLTALRQIITIDPEASVIMITASDNKNKMRESITAGSG